MQPSSALGRVVILKNLGSKPELNSRYANVEEYNPATGRYLVRFIDHTTAAPSLSAWVTEEKFDFAHPRVFPYHDELRESVGDDEDKLLARHHKQDSLDHPIRTAIVRDFDTDRALSINEKWLSMNEKGLILGASRGGVDENGLHLPRTRMRSFIQIILNSNAETLEIEDIYFDRSEDTVNRSDCVRIRRGSVTFRRCRFDACGDGAVLVQGTNESWPHVVFENCVFKSAYMCTGGSARFLNCLFRNCPTRSITVKNQSSVSVEYCDIRGSSVGIHCEGNPIKVRHSCIRDVKMGLYSMKGRVSIGNCLFFNATKFGVFSLNSSCTIERCTFEQCDIGVLKSTTGSACIVDSEMIGCGHGVHVGFDCVGSVTVNGCNFSRNVLDIAHGGPSKCVVSVDEIILKKNWETSINPRDLSGYIASNPENEYIIRRSLKNAGKSEYSPLCGHCGAQEPEDKKFKRCAGCTKIVYCSPECQNAAWKTHKAMCVA